MIKKSLFKTLNNLKLKNYNIYINQNSKCYENDI